LASEVAAERAVVESYALLALLRSAEAPDSPACLAVARQLHELSLRAQLLATAGALQSWTGDLDSLVHHPHAPFALLLSNPELGRSLGLNPRDLALAFARALAQVIPEEMPGFLAESGPTALDDVRRGLLLQIEFARIEQIDRELRRLPADSAQRPELENALRVLGAELSREPDLHRVRLPSSLAIDLAGELRDDGRSEEAKALAEKAKAALERADFLFGGPYLQEMIARAESIIGSCATDAGDPLLAERILNGALQRLETLSRSGFDDQRSKSVRSNVLVSLAVNANVKLRDQPKALAYFERAFELRQDDFTRTLLACYRARAGRGDEARALLREMPESPFNYYNIACTYALLGDVELALDYLGRELRAGSKSAGAIERQKAWARSDPDLDNLRKEARFEALVGS
jgi:tetratricopeptide (TPR) repeat protein